MNMGASEPASGEEEVHEDRSCVELELEVQPRVSEGINRAPSLWFAQGFPSPMEKFPACSPITDLHLGHVKEQILVSPKQKGGRQGPVGWEEKCQIRTASLLLGS